MKIFWQIFALATFLATFSKIWANCSESSGHPGGKLPRFEKQNLNLFLFFVKVHEN
jgi:hypothetical protein